MPTSVMTDERLGEARDRLLLGEIDVVRDISDFEIPRTYEATETIHTLIGAET
jgi:hypothetical protein